MKRRIALAQRPCPGGVKRFEEAWITGTTALATVDLKTRADVDVACTAAIPMTGELG